MKQFIKPPIKYTGSKFSELANLLPLFPCNIYNFYEPFVGGGSVFLNTDAKFYHINDFNKRIAIFWEQVFNTNSDSKLLKKQLYRLNFLNKERHSLHTSKFINDLEARQLIGYIYYNERDKFNNEDFSLSTTFWVYEFAYGGIERYNSKGKFNVPYGGISYNKKDISNKIETIRNLNQTMSVNVYCLDFMEFLPKNYENNDFVFLDPPYDTTFSSYGNSTFDKEDHIRLRDYLLNLDCKFLMVINENDFIKSLYDKHLFNTMTYNKTYKVNVKNRMKNNQIKHMVVKNY